MPCTIRQLTANGLIPVAYSADSLQAAVAHEPDDGVYTVANTVNRYQVLKLTAHLNRLADSAAREGIKLTLSHESIRNGLRELIDIADYGDVKFRVTVPHQTPNEPILSAEPYNHYAKELYTEGARVITVANSARHNPAAKDTAWMHNRTSIENKLPDGIHTAILLDAGGNLLEGTSSNFYAIIEGTLYTATEGVLRGTSQQVVLDVAPAILPIVEQPASVSNRAKLQEAFITSSSRGVMPVTEIDNIPIGEGKPGPLTLAIRDAFNAWVNDHLETL